MQVSLIKSHRNLLRFLWWKNGKTDEKPTDSRMTAHLFGARSSPGCVHLALRTAAEMFAKAGSKTADFIGHNFYADDGQPPLCGIGCRQILEMRRLWKVLKPF